MKDFQVKSPFRRATLDDVVFITRITRAGYNKHLQVYGIPFDTESMMLHVANVVTRGICLVGPNSVAGAFLYPFPQNNSAIIGQVSFWYFTKASEIRIFDAICDACKQAGATHINAASHYPLNSIARLYRKNGLHPCEIQAIKRL